MAEELNIHAVLPSSRVNGPGKRLVVFFQGCTRRCRGCFNPDTHSTGINKLYSAEGILDRFLSAGLEGITVSGGEPFLQPAGLARLLRAARMRGLTSVVYTGFRLEEIENDPWRAPALGAIDVLVDGAYEENLKEATPLARGSTNQMFHFLTGRYTLADLYMPGRVEVTIGPDGAVTGTGFSRINPTADI